MGEWVTYRDLREYVTMNILAKVHADNTNLLPLCERLDSLVTRDGYRVPEICNSGCGRSMEYNELKISCARLFFIFC